MQFNITSIILDESTFKSFMPPGNYQIDMQMTKKYGNKYRNLYTTQTFVTIAWK